MTILEIQNETKSLKLRFGSNTQKWETKCGFIKPKFGFKVVKEDIIYINTANSK